jgi:hypothetical protein
MSHNERVQDTGMKNPEKGNKKERINCNRIN